MKNERNECRQCVCFWGDLIPDEPEAGFCSRESGKLYKVMAGRKACSAFMSYEQAEEEEDGCGKGDRS